MRYRFMVLVVLVVLLALPTGPGIAQSRQYELENRNSYQAYGSQSHDEDEDEDSDDIPTLPGQIEIATGNGYCNIYRHDSDDPPVPKATASVRFGGTGGLEEADLRAHKQIGTGDGLEDACETLVNDLRLQVEEMSCFASPVTVEHESEPWYESHTWSFDFVCVAARDDLMVTIGQMMAHIMSV